MNQIFARAGCPKTFRFVYGGFHGGFQVLSLRNGQLRFSSGTDDPDRVTGEPLDVADRGWQRFGERLKDLGVLNWQRSYDDLGIVDGTQWELFLDWPGIGQVRSDGSNAYPAHFDQFLSAVSSLTNGAFVTGE